MPDPTDIEDEDAPLVASKDRDADNDMDITPMIDITFLLLIFFLVCSTPEQQSSFQLPAAKYGNGVGERESFFITVGAGGIDTAPVYLADGEIDDKVLPDDEEQQTELIRDAVTKAREGDSPKENIIIKADRNVAHRDVARVIKAVSKVEGAKIHLAVLEAD
ncbi:MAG: biopolymer transporter ExbD [Planctomycetota bacterium]